ncbi:hypothetical protein SAMN05444156_1321 [Verrucomicrobium sp. GAS474]|uniref:hypothetical protein n=1 Tax=Verrucomicrobium sp. GAS474 TaxID=1882831 RepID=UPI00087A0C7D|nr:hypothetical protein [Verrucomicrobium sp. GAS474]SDT99459.1 hypothetical protein SAMN05444156_1321 [Verrucomicrobium sp. GAS474]
MRLGLPLAAPFLLVVGIVWCVAAVAVGSPVRPAVAVACFAGLLFRERWVPGLAFAILAANQAWAISRAVDPGVSFLMEWGDLACVLLAVFLGRHLRREPSWWKIVGGIALLSVVPGGEWRPVCWGSVGADMAYTILALIFLAFALRAGKRAVG